jgi:Phage integrase, N-terminal SAM-like domain
LRLRRQTSHRTEASYLHKIVDFIRLHGKRHARELGVGEIRAHLSYQATEKDGTASTQNMALSTLLFLCRRVPGCAIAAGGEFPEDYLPLDLRKVLRRNPIHADF